MKFIAQIMRRYSRVICLKAAHPVIIGSTIAIAPIMQHLEPPTPSVGKKVCEKRKEKKTTSP